MALLWFSKMFRKTIYFYDFNLYSFTYWLSWCYSFLLKIPKINSWHFCNFHSFVFTSTYCWGSPFLLAVTVLVGIVGFPLFRPRRENGRCSFRGEPLLKSLAGYFFDFCHTNHRKSSNMCFFLIVLPPGRRLLLTPGLGMGKGIWDQLGPF